MPHPILLLGLSYTQDMHHAWAAPFSVNVIWGASCTPSRSTVSSWTRVPAQWANHRASDVLHHVWVLHSPLRRASHRSCFMPVIISSRPSLWVASCPTIPYHPSTSSWTSSVPGVEVISCLTPPAIAGRALPSSSDHAFTYGAPPCFTIIRIGGGPIVLSTAYQQHGDYFW